MPTEILTTKLYTPAPRLGAVMRPRLVGRLNAGLRGKLTLISAPAGFGKTTLVTEWIANGARKTAWLSLDDGDSDPVRFLTHFIAALQTIEPEIGVGLLKLLESPQPPSIDTLLTTLINEMATIQHDFALVLDDYHVLDNTEIDSALAFVIDNQPPHMHLVIMTRQDPRLPLARLRGRGQLTELRAADLRFTPDEAAEFLNHAMGLSLSPEDINALEERTEGWIAGLQLAAISMQGQTNPHQFVQSFTGSHRFIVDYLVEEVLNRQTIMVRDFLFQTSILDRMCASLCDAVTGQDDGQAMLEHLEQSNMLIVPLDNARRWYRYHNLFADILQNYLVQDRPEQVAHLHQCASDWYEQNGWQRDAIHHALIIDDYDRAADLIEMTWPALFNDYRPATFLSWIKVLPEDVVRNRSVLNVGGTWTLLRAGDIEGAEEHLVRAERWFDMDSAVSSELVIANRPASKTLSEYLIIARIYLSQTKGDWTKALDHCQRLMQSTTEDQYHARAIGEFVAGFSHWAMGNLTQATQSFTNSFKNSRLAERTDLSIAVTTALGELKLVEGHLQSARLHYEDALRMEVASDRFPVVRVVDRHIGISRLCCEINELQAAYQHLIDGQQEMAVQAILPGREARWHSAMARLKAVDGDLAGALEQLDIVERRYKRDVFPDFRSIAAQKARIWIMQGRLNEAASWLQEQKTKVDDDLSYMREFEHITLARLLLAQHARGDDSAINDAKTLLERLYKAAQAGGRHGTLIEILILQTLAYAAEGEPDSALAALNRALSLAEPEGYIRVFVDEGEAIQPLLALCLSRGAHIAYVKKLLDHLQPESGSKSPNQLLIEPLSERELEVLHLMANGHTNQTIADELFIALSTVKKHINNIYGKLNVANRTQAINRAREMELF